MPLTKYPTVSTGEHQHRDIRQHGSLLSLFCHSFVTEATISRGIHVSVGGGHGGDEWAREIKLMIVEMICIFVKLSMIVECRMNNRCQLL